MNEKAAKRARRINRAVGTLTKKSDIPVDAKGVVMVSRAARHKLPRAVKDWWAGLDHRTRGKAARHWTTLLTKQKPREVVKAEVSDAAKNAWTALQGMTEGL